MEECLLPEKVIMLSVRWNARKCTQIIQDTDAEIVEMQVVKYVTILL
ncbi:hypothetical protein [Butyrivibrio sp. WCE2006]